MSSPSELTSAGRYIILTAAFLGWMFSGFQMAVMTLASRSATTEFYRRGQLSESNMLALDRLFVSPTAAGQALEPLSDSYFDQTFQGPFG